LVIAVINLVGVLYLRLSANKALQTGLVAILLLVVTGYGYGVHERNKVWKTDEALWRDVTEKSPNNGRGWMNYGLTLMGKGDYKNADYCYQQALAKTPRYYILHINMGILKEATGNSVEAEQYFKNALAYGPGYVEPYYYYSRHLLHAKRIDEAVIYCEKGLQIFKGHMYSLYLLMDIYNYAQNWPKLKEASLRTLAIYPNDTKAQGYLAFADNPTSAVPPVAAGKATAADYVNQSMAYYHAGRYQECIGACRKALELQPNYAEAYNNICTAYNQLQKYDSAIIACNKAVELKPDFQLAKNNLNWAKSQLKK
jgi:tetratricopeptide (TPR) repeat protein